jgi:hypothetical protein
MNHRLNTLELLSLISSSVTVYCGLYFIADNSIVNEAPCKNILSPFTTYYLPKLNIDNVSEDAVLFLFILIVLSQSLFTLYWVYNFLHELRSTLRKKQLKLFYYLCLCCNKRKLEKEVARQ